MSRGILVAVLASVIVLAVVVNIVAATINEQQIGNLESDEFHEAISPLT